MSRKITVSFAGPFSWPGTPDAPSIFDADLRRQSGIYLWTIPWEEGHLIYYVGETGRSFEVRLLEHYVEHAACMYHVYSPAEFSRGEKVELWPGRYDSLNRKSAQGCIDQYPRLCAPIAELTLLYRLFIAPLEAEARERRRVEAAIAAHLYAQPDLVGAFQDRGIRYTSRRPDEEPIECVVTSTALLLGLPDRLLA